LTVVSLRNPEYAYFFFYSFVRNSYISRLTRKLPAGSKIPTLSTAAELLLGALAGALAQIFTIPVSVIATRQQVGRINSDDNADSRDDSFLSVAKDIVEEDGLPGLWSGLRPGLVLTVNPAITYGVFERVKGIIQLARAGDVKLSPWTSFLLGAFSKTLATVVSIESLQLICMI
jgi:adenine nucleotide transporter 17